MEKRSSAPQTSRPASPSVATVQPESRPSTFVSKSFLHPIRKLVSGNRARVTEPGFDLDMAYITSRILAMAFPATGIESAYRNPRHQVTTFLRQYHEDRYLVFNLCAESRYQYDASEFSHKIANSGAVCIPILDHNVPTLYQIADFCQQAMNWLNQHEENIVVVHCLGGKGRTGLMVSCLLVASKVCNTAPEAIELFNSMRTNDGGGGGLKIPSQIRWVKLFEELLVLSSNSVPLSITSLSVAKYSWTLVGVELGPTRALVHSLYVRRRNEAQPQQIELPILLQQRMKNHSVSAGLFKKSGEKEAAQVIAIDVKEGVFEAREDCHFTIKMRKGIKSIPLCFWLCSEMTQTMINHRSTSDGMSTLFLTGDDLDSPAHAEKTLGYKRAEGEEPSLPSERFFVKVSIRFNKVALS